MMNECLNQGRFPVIEKQSETEVVAYIKFQGMNEVAKHIWKLRDWINTNSLHLAGSPSCTMYFAASAETCDPKSIPCEVQWRVADAPRSTSNGIGLKLVEPQHILATFHIGDTATTWESFCFLEQTAAAEGYQVTGAKREVYYFDISEPKNRWITECQIHVDKKEKE